MIHYSRTNNAYYQHIEKLGLPNPRDAHYLTKHKNLVGIEFEKHIKRFDRPHHRKADLKLKRNGI